MPAFGETRASELNTHMIHEYIAKRQKAKGKNATINRELEVIKRSMTIGFRCDPPKVIRQMYIPMLPENNIRVGFLDDAGYLRLRDALPEHLRAIFVVGYHVGNRIGELLGLQWQQVDLISKQIRLNPGTTKNGKGRTMPIYGEMLPWLKMAHETRDKMCPNVFQYEGRAIGEFKKSWRSACAVAEVPGLLFHDLRRSAIRNMRLGGVAENVAMQISGHRTRSVFDRYDIVSDRDIIDAAAKMDARFGVELWERKVGCGGMI